MPDVELPAENTELATEETDQPLAESIGTATVVPKSTEVPKTKAKAAPEQQANRPPQWEGLPWRGTVPNLKQQEVDKVQLGREGKAQVFNLADAKEMAAYQKVIQLEAAGHAIIIKEHSQYDDSIKNWRVFVAWHELFYHVTEQSNGYQLPRR